MELATPTTTPSTSTPHADDAALAERLSAGRETIIRELRSDIGQLAVDLAGRIVGESLADEARRRGTVERFLADLDAVPAAGGRS